MMRDDNKSTKPVVSHGHLTGQEMANLTLFHKKIIGLEVAIGLVWRSVNHILPTNDRGKGY
jgi:hypothetical protein